MALLVFPKTSSFKEQPKLIETYQVRMWTVDE